MEVLGLVPRSVAGDLAIFHEDAEDIYLVIRNVAEGMRNIYLYIVYLGSMANANNTLAIAFDVAIRRVANGFKFVDTDDVTKVVVNHNDLASHSRTSPHRAGIATTVRVRNATALLKRDGRHVTKDVHRKKFVKQNVNPKRVYGCVATQEAKGELDTYATIVATYFVGTATRAQEHGHKQQQR